jgi:putative DNA primase/helicase
MTFNERHSDTGNARWFVRLHGAAVRFVYERQRWIINTGAHWREDLDGDVERMAKQAIDTMLATLGEVPKDSREVLFRHVLRSESASKIAAMLSLAKSEPGITILQAALDADPWLLGVQRGAVDLRTGEFQIPTSGAYITRRAGCEYRPHATCPTWRLFLDRILNRDVAMIAFLQRAIGYCLTGSTREQCLFIAHGSGSNGKSKLIEALRAVLGDYARECSAETLLAQRNSGINNDIARLAGARLVGAIETEDGKRLAESLVKALTGGDTITARFLHREFFEFAPQFKLWLVTNHRPTIRGNDHAIWRRIRLIPFGVTIPENEQDRDLGEKLAREYAGILNWAIEGCLAWQRDGLQTPEPVQTATANYRADMDRLGQWIEERCILTPTARVQAKFAYKDYREWTAARGEGELTMTSFGNRLTDRGIQKQKSKTVWYVGIGLCDTSTPSATVTDTFPVFPHYTDLAKRNTGEVSQVSQSIADDADDDSSAAAAYRRASRGE